jgi:regulatory protein
MFDDFNNDDKKIINSISRFCAYRERSVFETKQKLKSLGADSSLIEKIISWLIDNQFLNQSRFQESFVRSKVNQKKWGRNKIIFALKQNGSLDNESAKAALENIDADLYFSNLNHILKKKYNELLNRKSDQINSKLIRFALSKGFTYSEIVDALKTLNLTSDIDL